jgi:hypothetical protein
MELVGAQDKTHDYEFEFLRNIEHEEQAQLVGNRSLGSTSIH